MFKKILAVMFVISLAVNYYSWKTGCFNITSSQESKYEPIDTKIIVNHEQNERLPNIMKELSDKQYPQGKASNVAILIAIHELVSKIRSGSAYNFELDTLKQIIPDEKILDDELLNSKASIGVGNMYYFYHMINSSNSEIVNKNGILGAVVNKLIKIETFANGTNNSTNQFSKEEIIALLLNEKFDEIIKITAPSADQTTDGEISIFYNALLSYNKILGLSKHLWNRYAILAVNNMVYIPENKHSEVQ